MDFNVFTATGRLAAPPELRTFDSGARLVRFLLTVRTDSPRRRVDVLPVTLWDNDSDNATVDELAALPVGTRVHVVASVQRRFWQDTNGRSSRIEIVASAVEWADNDDSEGRG